MKLLPARYFGRANGQHRRIPRPHGALTGQRFVDCPRCGVATAATVHGAVVLCTEGHVIGGAA